VTDQPRQESPGGESGPATNPMPPVQPALGERAGRWALALGGAALLLMIVFPPGAPVPAIAALVVGVRARRRARRARTVYRGALAGVVMGTIGLVISIPLGTTQIVFWGELHRYLDCRQAANTITDEQACKDTFLREVEKKLDLREGSLRHYDLPL
jgi:hypothetical protein